MTRPHILGAASRTLVVASALAMPLAMIVAVPAVAQPAPEPPVLVVEPAELASVQPPQAQVSQELTISNPGAADLEWSLVDDGDEQVRLPVFPTTPVTVIPPTPGGRGSLAGFPGHRGRPGWTVAPVAAPVPSGEFTLTHSSSQAIVAGSGLACSTDRGLRTAATGYLRHFTLADYGITGDLTVSGVSFGVESMLGTAEQVQVHLYTLVDPAGEFRYDNFAPIGSAEVSVSAQSMSLVEVPVTGTVPVEATLVVEVAVPDLARGGLYLGAHPGDQHAPSYLRAQACGLAEPAPTHQLGAAGLQLLLNVTGAAALTGCTLPGDLPWLTVTPVAGSTAPGHHSELTVTFDSTGLVDGDSRATTLCLAGNDPARPRADVPVSLQVVGAPQIAVEPDELTLAQRAGEVSTHGLTIDNLGDSLLEWSVAVGDEQCGPAESLEWLAVDPAAGSTPAGERSDLTVTVDTTGLPAGDHLTRLCVDSNDPDQPQLAVPVVVSVFGPACDQTITGVHPGPLTVAAGVTCLAPGAQIQGEVNVLAGAGLVAESAVIQGPVATFDATVLELTSSQVVGPISVRGTTGSIHAAGNQVVGSVLVVNNRTEQAPVISANTIVGSLFCTGNQPPPVSGGAPNTVVGGMKLDQCAEL